MNTLMLTEAARAQSSGPVGTPPVRSHVDRNGVDLITGGFNIVQTDVSIGPQENPLSFTRVSRGSGWVNPYFGTVKVNGGQRIVSIGGGSESFTLTGGIYVGNQASGSTLTYNSSSQIYTYTMRDGTIGTFEPLINTRIQYSVYAATLTRLSYANGYQLTMRYLFQQHCELIGSSCNTSALRVGRLQSINSNTGYQLKPRYSYNPSPTVPFDTSRLDEWYQLTEVTALNNAVEYCNPDAGICTFSNPWPRAQYSSNGADVTDPMGHVTHYTFTNGRVTAIRRPTSGTANITIGYDSGGRVSSYSDGAGTWGYVYLDSGTTRTTTVTDPASHTRVLKSDLNLLAPTSLKNELGDTTQTEGSSG